MTTKNNETEQHGALQRQFMHARDVSVPLVVIRTADAAATVQLLSRVALTPDDKPAPVVQWDRVRGFQGVNTPGTAVARSLGGEAVLNPVDALVKLEKVAAHTAAFLLNGHDEYGDATFRQALWNLRDQFKKDWRTLVVTQPFGGVPTSLEHDVLVLDEPLPNAEELTRIVLAQFAAAKVPAPTDPAVVQRIVDRVAGLSAFAAEQATTLSLRRTGVDLEALGERHRSMITNTKGLSVWRGGENFATVGGLRNYKQFASKFLAGRYRIGGLLWLDELEKALAGVKGDLTGITQDYLATLLGFMQDENIPGILLMGHPGTGKSYLAKATAAEAQVPCIRMDLGAMHGSLVGESQHAIRQALKVGTAVSQGRLVVVATCNSVAILPPELVNRFKWRFFVDLPDAEEKKAIWPIHRAKYEIDAKDRQPDDTDWNGREIEQCCATAWMLRQSLREAAETVVPIAQSSAEVIEQRRREAHGRYLSASAPGAFAHQDRAVSVGGREVRIREDAWVAPGGASGKPS